jgi:hypothetical protein
MVERQRLVERLRAGPVVRVGGTTVLTGDVADRAMLYGYLERIEELGLELLEWQQVKRGAAVTGDEPR